MIKLVVFDWNGTLLADVAAIYECSNIELAAIGHQPLSLQRFREAFDVPLPKYYQNLGIYELYKSNSVAMNNAFHENYEPRAAKTRTRTGARQLLDWLGAQHISRIILSNHTVTGIDGQLVRLKLDHHFEAVLANEDTFQSHSNGKQHRLELYLNGSHIKPNETLIIGDSPEEIEIGKNLGLKTVALSGGFCTVKRLKAAKPDVLIHKLHDLIHVIEEA